MNSRASAVIRRIRFDPTRRSEEVTRPSSQETIR
jgi:hypothetical protein